MKISKILKKLKLSKKNNSLVSLDEKKTNPISLEEKRKALAFLEENRLPAIRLLTDPSNEEVASGFSKIGGIPDVPENFKWPSWNEKNLAFLAQINLADLNSLSIDHHLPSKGLLSFFYDIDQRTWGFDPKDKGSWRVYYFHPETRLISMKNPQPSPDYQYPAYQECTINFEITETYPDYFSDIIQFSPYKNYRFFEDFFDNRMKSTNHQLGGLPTQVQNAMELECQFASNGVYFGDGKYKQNPNFEQLKEGAKDWRLLFQLDTDDNSNMMWGDVGMLYFWIKEDDLKNMKFENTWMVLQCH